MSELKNKVALVTGGGRGLGRAMALAIANAGSDVAVASRTRQQLEEVSDAARALGCRALAVQVDVSDPGSVAQMVRATQQEFGRIDILVNSAGVGSAEQLVDVSDKTWDWILKTNLYGTFYCCRDVARVMIEQKGGSIINIASVAGMKGPRGLGAYAASKGGVIQLTKVLALEVARYNVRVNAIAPGYFRTDMNAAAFDDPGLGPKMIKRIPLRRPGQPAEIGSLAVLLASDEASFITGEVYSISGGEMAQ